MNDHVGVASGCPWSPKGWNLLFRGFDFFPYFISSPGTPGTAGSCTLLAQIALPCLLFAPEPPKLPDGALLRTVLHNETSRLVAIWLGLLSGPKMVKMACNNTRKDPRAPTEFYP